jgi:hypothetical protein
MNPATITAPAEDLRAARELLGRPFMPAAAEFMVISAKEGSSRAGIAMYLSRTSIEDRLDFVVGADHWEAVPVPEAECVKCELTIFGTMKASLGQGSDRWSQEANAFKRAAKAFGVGRYLYTLGPIWKPIGEGSMQVRVGKRSSFIPDDLIAQLRKEYANYLRQVAIPRFGLPLDHEATSPLGNGGPIETTASPAPSPAPSHNGNGDGNGNGARNGGGKPEAVAPNGNGGAPVDPETRDRLRAAIEAGHFGGDAVSNVAELLYGERITDRLAAPQMSDLIDAITLATEGAFTDETLGGLASRGLEQSDREDARKEFIAYVLRVAKRQQAQEAKQ